MSTRISRSTVAAASATRKPGPRRRPRRRRSRPPPPRRCAGGRARPRGTRRTPRAPPAPARATCRALRDLRRRRRAAELARHLVGHAVDLDRQLLEVARHPHRPALVAEVALDLAEDRGNRERRERRLARRVEAVDRLEQAERGDLDEVVERLPAALVAAGELARQRQEALDELLARRDVAVAVVADQQAPVLLRAQRPLGDAEYSGAAPAWRPCSKRLSMLSTPTFTQLVRLVRAGALGRGKASGGLLGPTRAHSTVSPR